MRRIVWCACVALVIGLIMIGWICSQRASKSPDLVSVPPPREIGQVGANPATLIIRGAEPLEEMNAHFNRTNGWIGADGAHSVSLGSDRTLWLFSDTWVGGVRDGKRFDATIVNNSLAIQHGRGATATIRFVVRRGNDEKPQALFAPTDGRGWFWMQAGAVVEERLLLFLTQVEKTGEPGVFGFRSVDQWIGVVSNPHDDPFAWHTKLLRLPHTVFSPERELTFGAAVLKHEGYLYIYGTDEDVRPKGRDRYLIVARVAMAAGEDFAKWEFFHDGRWQSDFRRSTRLVPGMASDGSVTYLPERRQYALVYTEGGLSERILVRTAPDPWGPWSDPVTVYRCPESGWDRRIFCYNAKAHGALSGRDELVVSYVANSFEFWHVAADARLYWPRFVRVRLE